MLETLPRARVGLFPTPVVELSRLTSQLGGPRILIKRDDLNGVACGGNKIRKLEFLLGAALLEGADCVVTGGAAQSNHCRQTAAAAAMVGLSCHLALGGEPPDVFQGNVLLDRLLGAQLHWCGSDRKGERIPEICSELRRQGRRPYVIPYGGSNHTGALGFVAAVAELAGQMKSGSVPAVTHLVFASSSGGTQAGLMVGSRLYRQNFQIIGIAIDKEELAGESLADVVFRLAGETAARLRDHRPWNREDVTLQQDYAASGYGVLTPLERDAIDTLAMAEGVLLDPVYTGRAMGALLSLVRGGYFTSDDTVLFWHTGGTPALFSYAEALLSSPA